MLARTYRSLCVCTHTRCQFLPLVDPLSSRRLQLTTHLPAYSSSQQAELAKLPSSVFDMPTSDMTLKWVHGFSGTKTRSCVKYNGEGKLVYPAACVIVVYDPERHRQHLFTAHKQEVRDALWLTFKHLCSQSSLPRRPPLWLLPHNYCY